MVVKEVCERESSNFVDISKAINWALEKQAKIINCSIAPSIPVLEPTLQLG